MRFCRDVPVFVEVGEAGIAVECYASSAFVFNSLGDVLGLMSCKRSSENDRAAKAAPVRRAGTCRVRDGFCRDGGKGPRCG